ncbi:hypothetical protein QZH41_013179 [Actinostola sp. cb2023]|nr:hypothetical protein QZH41_013179 [Actinostola sp. cb2023]
MPNKKNKNQPKNAFYYYMVSLRPQLQRQGVVLENGMASLAEIAGPRWKDLPEHEKEVYQEMARQAKSNKEYGRPRNDRKDCTGQFLSQRVDTVSLNENKRRRQRDEVKSKWPPGKLICDEKFYLVGFMSLCQVSDEVQLPCEVGVAEFSINGGIIRTMHKFIKPGTVKSYRIQLIQKTLSAIDFKPTRLDRKGVWVTFLLDTDMIVTFFLGERTHKIPVTGLAKEEDTYYNIFIDLMAFINPEGQHAFPPVYSRASEAKQTESCLDWLAMYAGMPNRLKKVYELEGLICDLYGHVSKAEMQSISKSQATELISSTIFDYELGARCEWHESEEVKYCALGTVKRYCYCMADFLCPHYNVVLTTRHMPERPEGTFCTVLTTNDNTKRSNNTSTEYDDDDSYNSYASYNNIQRTQMGHGYGSSNMDSYNMYHRTGPTYESSSLSTSGASGGDAYPSLQQEQRTFQEQALTVNQQASFATSINEEAARFPLGRGRGRGRGVPSNAFVRQPNMAQQTIGRGMGNRPGPSVDIKTSSASTSDEGYISRGRGVRVPNTKPKVYAGSASAPHPSNAPPPPLAWQQQPQQLQQQPQQQQPQSQREQQQQQVEYNNYEQTNRLPWQAREQESHPTSSVYGMHNISDVMEMMAKMNMVQNQ